MNVNINPARCGSGKTTLYIYKKCAECIIRGEPVLVVVPSIQLQQQYVQDLVARNIRVIMINSENHADQVGYRIELALNDLSPRVVVVTHAAFLAIERPSKDWVVEIDEAPTLYGTEKTFSNDGLRQTKYQPDFKIPTLFSSVDVGGGYYELIPTMRVKTHERYYKLVRELMHPNRKFYIEGASWEAAKTGNYDDFHIFWEVSLDFLDSWKRLSISAAHAKRTWIGSYVEKHHGRISVIWDGKFVPHLANISFHIPVSHTNSKTHQGNNPNFEAEILAYAEKYSTAPYLFLANKDRAETLELPPGSHRADHNIHGYNGLRHITNIMITSALNPDKKFVKFMTWYLGRESNESIRHARSSNLFYQVIMRGATRVDPMTPVNVFLADTTIGEDLMGEYFSGCVVVTFDPSVVPSLTRPNGKCAKKIKDMTPDELREYKRQKQIENRAKKKASGAKP